MATTEAAFRLCKANVAMFREVSDFYDLDISWLTSQFEQYTSKKGITPFCISTQSHHSKNSINEDVDEVAFEISFHPKNANLIQCIRFHEMPSDKHFIITETSMLHTQQSTGCRLWLELPRGALENEKGGGDSSVLDPMEVNICCDGWKEFIPPVPATELERTHLFLWLKEQVDQNDSAVLRIKNQVAHERIKGNKLKNANEKLQKESAALKAEIKVIQSSIESRTAGLEKLLEQYKALVQELRAELEDMKATIVPDESDCPTPKATPVPRDAKVAEAEGHQTTPTKKNG
ncbi:hypothetical protein M406DRAFT_328629 [Cryphonectria parasitica EP155]|uniref:Uncharacterized protein n=1 Tax=Cryphonectria parasitica (strain ATCC 38755 / EP155) TaxID=660469 RepID=A0A9P4Y6P9_CRYP1|nr:uncharacterized protein M406DRAFT_328629 [Cryphonectria parasitica EP155]KAF3767558.1 hypothetical protein M406DRAFT_328629 [Cryphonectria parasitica EP155]